jgi:hypothetical protein
MSKNIEKMSKKYRKNVEKMSKKCRKNTDPSPDPFPAALRRGYACKCPLQLLGDCQVVLCRLDCDVYF